MFIFYCRVTHHWISQLHETTDTDGLSGEGEEKRGSVLRVDRRNPTSAAKSSAENKQKGNHGNQACTFVAEVQLFNMMQNNDTIQYGTTEDFCFIPYMQQIIN